MSVPPLSSSARFYALRLEPGDDVSSCLDAFIASAGLRAAFIASAVGSLTKAVIRFANRPTGTTLEGHFEVTSLVGCLGEGGSHLHLTLSDGEGRCIGGHLLPGSSVYTTLEIVIGELVDVAFGRAPCPKSGYDELRVIPRTPSPADA